MSFDVLPSFLVPDQGTEDSPGFLTWQIAMCWQRKINQALDSADITYTQFIVLLITLRLSEIQPRIFQHQVATHARIDRMMTSRVMSNLEKKNLLKRGKLSGDARTNVITITKKGAQVIHDAMRIVSKMESEFFSLKEGDEKRLTGYFKQILPNC